MRRAFTMRSVLRSRSEGFTLLEVMIALAIVSVALLAAMRALALSTDQQHQLHARRLALTCADNHLAELTLSPPRAASVSPSRCLQDRTTFLVTTRLEQRNQGGWQAQIAVRAASGGRRLALLEANIAAPELNPSQ